MRYIYSEEMVKRLFSLSIITMHKNLNETDTLKNDELLSFFKRGARIPKCTEMRSKRRTIKQRKADVERGKKKVSLHNFVFKSREKTRVLDIKYILDGFFSAWCGKGHGNSLLCTTNIFCIGAISLLNCFLFRVSVVHGNEDSAWESSQEQLLLALKGGWYLNLSCFGRR